MGRPRLAEGQRPFSVNVYLTEDPWRKLIAASKEKKISKSEFIRQMLNQLPEGKTS